ncbi:MAG: MBL fold metallo-hydrolase [Nevskiaceae bacterium]|jgi:hydroxyacylglutathione hydrolase|nr:MBL fold metallo-hydrolase [Nevskiaceae bacterium]
MIVERLWPNTPLRNYHYLVVCAETGDALAIDPWDADLVARIAREHGWTITQILNTHHHHDHCAGNEALRALTGATVMAHANAAATIGNVDRKLKDGDVISVGKSVEMECLDTPGHTLSHVCLFAHADQPALFSGDTLFNAGAGNCHNGGDPDRLYETFVNRLAHLPENTRIFPGHDYLLNNLGFTLDREPDNEAAAQLRSQIQGREALAMPVTTLADEQRINTFFRLQNPEVVENLRRCFTELPAEPTARQVFVCLRQLRNKW